MLTPQRRNSCKSELKSFLSAKNLNDLHVSVKNSANFHQQQDYNHENLYKNDQVSRLLDDLSDQENNAGQDPINNEGIDHDEIEKCNLYFQHDTLVRDLRAGWERWVFAHPNVLADTIKF